MDNLYDWYFHFNHYTGYWNAVKRDKTTEYMNGTLKPDDILKSKNIKDLINYITKNV